MSMYKGPSVFDPAHPNRFAQDAAASSTSAGSGGRLVSKKDRMKEDLGLSDADSAGSITSDEEDEDPDTGMSYAAAHGLTPTTVSGSKTRSSKEASARHIARLQQELDELADKLTKTEASHRLLKQQSKAATTMLQRSLGEQMKRQSGVMRDMYADLQRLSADKERLRSYKGSMKELESAIPTVAPGSGPGDKVGAGDSGSSAESDALRGALAESEAQVASLTRKVRQLELAGSASAGSAPAATVGASSEEIAGLQSRIASLERELTSAQKKMKSGADPPPLPPPTNSEDKKQLAAASRRIQELEEELASVKASAGKSASDAVAALQSTVDELRAQLSSAREEADDAKSKVALMEESSASMASSSKAELKELEKKYQTREKEREGRLKQKAQEQFANLKSRAEAEIQALREENDKTKSQLDAQSQQLAAAGQWRTGLARSGKSVQLAAANFKRSAEETKRSVRDLFAEFAPVFEDTNRQLAARVKTFAGSFGSIVEMYRKEQRERKRLFNLVQELRGNIRVYCRVRPRMPAEEARGESVAVSFPAEGEVSLVNSKRHRKTWEFDQVFQPGTTNEQVFEEIGPLVTSTIDGYNVCIFAYGQTGSGKTYTMEGNPDARGVNYRALDRLFQLRNERAVDTEFEVKITLLEIYNEEIRDMLRSPGSAPEKLSVKEGRDGMFVPGLTMVPVNSRSEVLDIMKTGYRNRSTFATNMNEHSSRSHCMLSVYVQGVNKVTGLRFKGKLHLVDLAGSERVSKSGATGVRMEEAKNINKSLSALGDVIQSRAQKAGHVPFRNSTLTYLLKDSLSNDSKTLMFVNMSPAVGQADESVCSLNFASRVRTVELGKATKHVSKK